MPTTSQPDAPLTITGSALTFTFHYFEIPEWVRFGGPFQAIVHSQPGGTRQIDSLGPNPGPISWDGIILAGADGATGAQRAIDLYSLYEAGDRVTASYGIRTVDCIISSLKIAYKAVNYIEYAIELTEVISRNVTGQGNVAGPTNSSLQVTLNNAQQVVGASGLTSTLGTGAPFLIPGGG